MWWCDGEAEGGGTLKTQAQLRGAPNKGDRELNRALQAMPGVPAGGPAAKLNSPVPTEQHGAGEHRINPSLAQTRLL